ncbi:MAG: DUF3500 domain-containing protein [Verrucomicrobiota bacterium]
MPQTDDLIPVRPLAVSVADRLDRRGFLQAAATGLAAAALPAWMPRVTAAAPAEGTVAGPSSETLVGQLYRSLDEAQRGRLCFAFDHPLRDKVDNNWMITRQSIRDGLTADQQDLVRQIFRGLHRPEQADAMMRQVVEDSEGKGFEGGTSIALFGEPGTGKFEFVLTGRHCTRRCDGDSVTGAAFGGPIFYGHQAGPHDEEPADHPGNVFWSQAQRVNAVYQALDGRQRGVALVDGRGRGERATETVQLSGRRRGLPGIRLGDLSDDQRGLVRQVMADLLLPFRAVDAAEALKLTGGASFEDVHLAFFKQQDLGNDGVWDVWQLEGPRMLWYFRGAPHVHCWVHIRDAAA